VRVGSGSASRSVRPAQPQTQVHPELPKRVHVSSGVIAGLLIKRVSPDYPEKAGKKRIQGTVLLSEVINLKSSTRVEKSPTFR
jgi:hypothetical protein